ncbi:MAG: FkbM family methyltransferase [Blastocatellales bacterium]
MLKKLGKLTRLLRLRNEALIQIDGIKAYVDLCDPRMFMVFGELRDDTPEARIMQSLMSAGDTFIDVGANHGSYSLVAAGYVGTSGKVLAFEPQPRLASLIRKSFAVNGYSNAEVYEIACSDHSGQAEFYLPENSSGTAGIYRAFSANSAHQKIQVRLERFDDLIEWQALPGRIFLKLDVEGSELAFLRGAEQMLRHRKPYIVLEINPDSAQAAGYSTEEILSFLISLGYGKFSEVDDWSRVRRLSDAELTEQRNILVLA